MLSIEDFKAMSIEDAYLAYRDKFESYDILLYRLAELSKLHNQLWEDYRKLYLSNKK